VFSSLDHVIHAGQTYTISSASGRGMSADYKSVFRLAISRTVLENREISANFDSPQNFFGGRQNFKTSLGYSLSGTIARKSFDHAPDPKGVGKNFAHPKFFWGRAPKG